MSKWAGKLSVRVLCRRSSELGRACGGVCGFVALVRGLSQKEGSSGMKQVLASTSSLDASLQELFGIEVQVSTYFSLFKGIHFCCRRKS